MEKWHIISTNITIFDIYLVTFTKKVYIKKNNARHLIFGEGRGVTTCCIYTNNVKKMLLFHLFYVIHA